MTISTHTRVERGYYRRYYERTVELRRKKAREAESNKCRYRRGWANWLIAELRKIWSAEMLSGAEAEKPIQDQLTPGSLETSVQWMSCARAGRLKPSTGRRVTRTRSTG